MGVDHKISNTKINQFSQNVVTIEIVDKKLSFFSKLCFAMAGMPYHMYFCAVSVFVTVFLLETADLPPAKLIYILFISRIIDALTDPIYGFLVNSTKLTKYGRMKPW